MLFTLANYDTNCEVIRFPLNISEVFRWFLPLTLLSVLAALAPPSAGAAGAAEAAVGLMAETTTQEVKRQLVSLNVALVRDRGLFMHARGQAHRCKSKHVSHDT